MKAILHSLVVITITFSLLGCRKSTGENTENLVADTKQIPAASTQKTPVVETNEPTQIAKTKTPEEIKVSEIFKLQLLDYLRISGNFRADQRVSHFQELYTPGRRAQLEELYSATSEGPTRDKIFDATMTLDHSRGGAVKEIVPELKKVRESYALLNDLWPKGFAEDAHKLLKDADTGFWLTFYMAELADEGGFYPNESGQYSWSNFVAYAGDRLEIRKFSSAQAKYKPEMIGLRYVSTQETNVTVLLDLALEHYANGRQRVLKKLEETK